MNRKRFEHLLNSAGILRHPCDLDLLLFFHRHPRALMTSERLATYVGYDLKQVGRSLDLLAEAGVLERSQNPTHAARMYVLKAPETGWLASLLEIGSTQEGRRTLIETMREAASPEESDDRPGPREQATPTSCRSTKAIAR